MARIVQETTQTESNIRACRVTKLRAYVPDDTKLRKDIVEHFHGIGHLGVSKVYSKMA